MSFENMYKAAVATLWIMLWITGWLIVKLKIKPLRIERLPRKPRPEYVKSSLDVM